MKKETSSSEKSEKYHYFLVTLIFVAAFSRLMPHPNNFTPLLAISLIGTSYLRKAWPSVVVPMAALLISDLFLGFYSYMWAVYGAFFLIALFGFFYARNFSCLGKILFIFPASIVFFFTTNSAVFFQSSLYADSFNGYLDCLLAGLPFYKNSLAGDLVYSGIFVSVAELLKWKFIFNRSKTLQLGQPFS